MKTLLLLLFCVVIHFLQVDGRHIVNGYRAKDCEVPAIVFVYTTKKSGGYLCAGTIVDRDHIITAAHCVSSDVLDVTVLFGSYHLRSMTHKQSNVSYKRHEGYNRLPTQVYNDIAVLTLNEPILFDECISPIPIATTEDDISDDCVIAGWGKTGENDSHSEYLLRASVPVMGSKKCEEHSSVLEEQHLCVGKAIKMGTTTCKGDSGGPLMCRRKSDNKLVLRGVVSYGWTCTEGLAVFARVSYFKDWIEKQFGK